MAVPDQPVTRSSLRGRDNLIPAAASRTPPKRPVGPGTDTYVHMKFVVWAMQVRLDAITVRRVKDAFKVSTATAQRLRQMWLTLTASRFYHDSARYVVEAMIKEYSLDPQMFLPRDYLVELNNTKGEHDG